MGSARSGTITSSSGMVDQLPQLPLMIENPPFHHGARLVEKLSKVLVLSVKSL
jgi:16S rRNA G1207 methylase RsmC